MAKRKVLKITPVLITLNVLVLIIIIAFYTTRLIKYYLEENGPFDEEKEILLVDEIKRKQSFLDETKGLVYDEKNNIYRYKGQVEDNYILYSGMLYRIIAIDNENNIRAVSEENVTLMYPGFDNGYEKSYVNKWLNKSEEEFSGIYEDTLVDSDDLLVDTYMCNDVINDISKITCNDLTNSKKITLLSLFDYKEAGGKSSYLNNGELYYFGSLNENNQEYFVNENGEIALNKKSSKAIYVKPVITFNSETVLLDGNGKKETPYIVEKHEINNLKDVYVNSVIKMGNLKYRVIDVKEDKVKLALIGVLKENEKDDNLNIAFGGSNSAYSSSNTVGSYLNKTFLDSLELKDSVISSDWYNGKLSLTSLDYKNAFKNKTNAKVGMLSLADMFVQEEKNVFTLLRGMEANNIINVINKDGNIFGDTISSKYNVRPAFYLNGDLIITKGKGTDEDPYELGVNDGKKEENEKGETKEE